MLRRDAFVAGKLWRGAVILLLLLTGCFGQGQTGPSPEPLQPREFTFIVMDTLVTVRAYTKTETQAETVFLDIEAEMKRLEGILSAHITTSEVSAIGNSAGQVPVKVSQDTLTVISTALNYAALTDGAFDITVAKVLRLYNFTPGQESKPTRQERETSLPLVDWRKVVVDSGSSTVFLAEPGMQIDLGGIAKGFITDKAVAILNEHGIEYGLINAGGDIRLLGPKIDESPWRVGIKNPLNPSAHFASIEVSSGSIVTSGDYERKFDEDGVRYHHIIDPFSGLPADQAKSVTILAPNAQTADLLSTAVFVMGPEAGMELVENIQGVEAVIWSREDQVTWSSGLELVPGGSSDQYYYRVR